MTSPDVDADLSREEKVTTAIDSLFDMSVTVENDLLEATGLESVTDFYHAQQLKPNGTVTLENLELHHYELVRLVQLLDTQTESNDIRNVVPSVRTLLALLEASPDHFVADVFGIEDAPVAEQTTVDSDDQEADEIDDDQADEEDE